MQRMLVTGAAGFVGRALLPVLCRTGMEVRAAVRRIDGAPPDTPVGVEWRAVGDIGPGTDWREALDGVDAVVHLAARVHVMDEQAVDPLAEFRKVNVAGTERLARAAAAAGVRRLVYLSSVKVNGESSPAAGDGSRPFTEADPPRPEDPYGISKWEAELALARVAAETGLQVVVLRPPLVYGPGVRANFLALVRIVDRGLPLPLASVGNRRSLVYAGNLADAIRACLVHPNAAGRTFLVSDGESLSTADLVRAIAWALGRKPRLLPFPPALLRLAGRVTGRASQVERLAGSLEVDSSLLRATLDWTPPHTVAEGLAETARWYRQLPSR